MLKDFVELGFLLNKFFFKTPFSELFDLEFKLSSEYPKLFAFVTAASIDSSFAAVWLLVVLDEDRVFEEWWTF